MRLFYERQSEGGFPVRQKSMIQIELGFDLIIVLTKNKKQKTQHNNPVFTPDWALKVHSDHRAVIKPRNDQINL